jgi:hypothetical protein
MANSPILTWLPDFSAPGQKEGALARKAIEASLAEKAYNRLELYYYAASVPGWQMLEPAITTWVKVSKSRSVHAWIGTDMGATDPLALRSMLEAGVDLQLPLRYNGTYHPKMIVLRGDEGGQILFGSHNLSRAALSVNGEVSAAMGFKGQTPQEMADWCAKVQAASDLATDPLIKSYEQERNRFHRKHKPRTFTWSKRAAVPAKPKGRPGKQGGLAAAKGALVMEVKPLETGSDGKQVQPPMAVLTPFFGLPAGKQASKAVQARLKGAPHYTVLTVSRNANSTGRIHIRELDYDDRPCFLVFTRAHGKFEYEIVSEPREPARYAALSKASVNQANQNARRWAVLDRDVAL